MPHIIVEFSQNLTQHVDIDGLLAAVHGAARETGCFEIDTIRTRAAARSQYLIGDTGKSAAFLAIDVRMGPGQSEAVRKRIGEQIFAAAQRAIAGVRTQLKIRLSLELREASPIRLREEPDPAGTHP